jgi:hypothetical protein
MDRQTGGQMDRQMDRQTNNTMQGTGQVHPGNEWDKLHPSGLKEQKDAAQAASHHSARPVTSDTGAARHGRRAG